MMFTWVISNYLLQFSDPCYGCLRYQAIQQGFVGYLEADGSKLRIGFSALRVRAFRGRSYGRRRIWDVGQEHTSRWVTECQGRLWKITQLDVSQFFCIFIGTNTMKRTTKKKNVKHDDLMFWRLNSMKGVVIFIIYYKLFSCYSYDANIALVNHIAHCCWVLPL